MTEDEKATTRLLIDPSSTVLITDEVCAPHKFSSSKEDWTLLNADLIKSIGAETWLNNLLEVLSLPLNDYDGHDIINPTLAITVSPKLLEKSSKPVKRDDWINANAKLIAEMGAAEWLMQLLGVLETGGSQ